MTYFRSVPSYVEKFICSWIYFYILTQSFLFQTKINPWYDSNIPNMEVNYKNIRLSNRKKCHNFKWHTWEIDFCERYNTPTINISVGELLWEKSTHQHYFPKERNPREVSKHENILGNELHKLGWHLRRQTFNPRKH